MSNYIKIPKTATLQKKRWHEIEYTLGTLFKEGLGVKGNAELGIAYLLRAAKKGHVKAQIELAEHYIDGPVKKFEFALQWLTEAAKESKEGKARLESYMHKFNSNLKSENVFNKADALYWFSICYEKGIGVSANLDKVLENLEKASELDHPFAQLDLANLYIFGQKSESSQQLVQRNLEKAFDLYQKAASHKTLEIHKIFKLIITRLEENIKIADSKDQADYEYCLGMLKTQKFPSKEAAEVSEHLDKAAKKGQLLAQIELSRMYFEGDTVPKNYLQALKGFLEFARNFPDSKHFQTIANFYHVRYKNFLKAFLIHPR